MKLPGSRRTRDAELDEEIRAHLKMAATDREDRGQSPLDAARAARREFGNVAEEAYALLGRGRSLRQLGQYNDARESLATARQILARLGATPLVAEVDDQLALTRAPL